jgi:hypothetical protein
MSNKIQLQANNIDLQTIKNNVEELPESNAWTGQTSIVPGTQSITIPAYTDKELTVQGDADLIAVNIAAGIQIFGVNGSANVAPMKVTTGSFVPTESGFLKTVTVQHGIGATPRFFMAYSLETGDGYDCLFFKAFVDPKNLIYSIDTDYHGGSPGYERTDRGLDSTTAELTARKMFIGATYHWIAVA